MLIIKIISTFLLLVLLLRLKIPFIISILFTALILGLTFKLSLGAMAKTTWITLIKDATTLNLMIIVGLILVFSELLKHSGHLSQLSQAIIGVFGAHRFTLATMPALIGLLPMPGGALFSAPLVEVTEIHGYHIPPHKKTLFNHWFRHIWEYSWPLYPGVILAASLANVPLSTLCFFQFPLTLIAIAVGIVCIFPTISLPYNAESASSISETEPTVSSKPTQQSYARNIFKMIYLLLPIILVITLFLSLNALLGTNKSDRINLPMLLALLAGCSWAVSTAFLSKRLTLLKILKITFAQRAVYQMILIVLSVMVFVNIMKASCLSDDLTGFFCNYQLAGGNIINILAILFLPFIVGLLTGLTIAYVGTTMLIIINVFIPPQMAYNPLPYIMLGYAAGFTGVLISPTHLCLVLTNKYFGSTLSKVYRHLIPAAFIFLGIVLGLFLLYTTL